MTSRGIEILIHYCGSIENVLRSTCLITESIEANILRASAAFLELTRTLSGNRCDASESLLCAFGCSGALGRPGSMGGTGGSHGFKVLINSRIAGFLSHPQRIAFDPFPDHGYHRPVEEQVLIEQPMLVEGD